MTDRMLDTHSMQAGRTPPSSFRVRSLVESVTGITAYAPGIPPDERELILDISHWNGTMDMVKAKAAGARGIYHKATESDYWKDQVYNTNQTKAVNAGLPWGGYHFLRPTPAGNYQAAHYLTVTGEEAGCKLPHVLDVEVAMPAWVVRSYVEKFLERRGYFPMIYTSNYCWSLVTGATDKAWITARCHLDVAHWGATNPLLPPGWVAYDMHQFQANGNGRAAEFGSTNGDADMDLNYVRKTWLAQYDPPPVPSVPNLAILWREAGLHGWNLNA